MIQKIFIPIFILSLFCYRLILADSTDFRIIVTRNDQSIGGELHADLEMHITAGEDTNTLHSLTSDIYYNAALSDWGSDPVVEWGVWGTDSAYFRTAARLTGRYRVLITQGDTCGVNHRDNATPPGDPEGWDARTVWKKIVTLRWEIASLTAPTLSINDDTDAAAYFENYQNIPYGSTLAANWDVSNQDLSNPLLVKAKMFLEGPYIPADDTMRTAIYEYIPNDSPYSSDLRNVTSIPDSIVDWILVQLRETSDGSAIASKSAFVSKSGQIVEANGKQGVSFDAANNSYFIVLKHRNHLAIMSDETWALSSTSSIIYDFTIDESSAYDKYYGGDAAILETGIYGLYSGDANDDGFVTATDKNNTWRPQNGTSGYKEADLNLDAFVTATDKNSFWRPNNGKGSQVP